VRIVGVALIAGLGLARFKGYLRQPLKGAILLVLGVWGVLSFFGYLQLSQGLWNASLRTTAAWNRHFELVGFFKSLWFFVKFAYFPTILLVSLSFCFFVKTPRDIALSIEEKLCFFMLLFIPMASSMQTSLTRYVTVVLVAYVAWAWLILKFQHKFWYLFWAVILVTELCWQVVLTQKFFTNQAFLWAG
jgi:hypothetical protein